MALNEASKVARGMVFWYDPTCAYKVDGAKSGGLMNGHLEFKNRPHLVVSNNQGNFSSPTVNLVPITHSLKKGHLPCQVMFTNWQGQANTILTEQILTANIADLKEYICTLSESVMDRVDRALVVQLLSGKIPSPISQVDISLNELEERLTAITDKVMAAAKAKMEAEIRTLKLTGAQVEEAALTMATQVEDLLGTMTNTVPDTVSAVVEHAKAPGEETVSQPGPAPKSDSRERREPVEWDMTPKAPAPAEKPKRQRKPKTEKVGEATQPKAKRGKVSKYSVKFMVQYLRDFDIYPPRMMCDRYGINDRKALYPKKYYFISRLEEMGIDYKTWTGEQDGRAK